MTVILGSTLKDDIERLVEFDDGILLVGLHLLDVGAVADRFVCHVFAFPVIVMRSAAAGGAG